MGYSLDRFFRYRKRYWPIPLTVPKKPIEGIAHAIYLIIDSSESSLSDSDSHIALIELETSCIFPVDRNRCSAVKTALGSK